MTTGKPDSRTQGASHDGMAASKPVIVVIEDESSLRHALKLTLDVKLKRKVEVLVAENHEKAREMLADMGVKPSLILSDNDTMNGNDGLTWLEELRAQGADLKVMLMTGGDMLEAAQAMCDAGHPNLIGVHSKYQTELMNTHIAQAMDVAGLGELSQNMRG